MRLALIIALLAFSGCASREAYNRLALAESGCKAGDQDACKAVPIAKAIVHGEEYNAGARIGAPIGAVSESLVIGGLVATDAYVNSPPPTVVYVRTCRHHWC